jgi:hypothetical protein
MLPSSVLAGIKPGDRVVYSTVPNRMQQRMPFNVQPIVNDFVYNHNLLAQSAPQLRQQEEVNIIGGLTAGEPLQGVSETHLVLTRGWRSTTVQVEIKFADRNGLYVGQGTTSVTPEYAATQPGTSEEGKVIELSELSRQMAVIMAQELAAPTSDRMVYRMATVDGGNSAFVTVNSGDSAPKLFPDELLQVFVNPDKTDPCSLYVSECFIQAARAEGKDLVATFPDSIVRDLARILVKGNVTHKAVLAASPAFGLDVQTVGDWMSVLPVWANNARETRFDRSAAGTLFRAVNGRGFASLDELADYSFHVTTGLAERTLDSVLLTLINKDAGDQLNEYTSMNLDMLRLWATLPDNAKRTAGEKMQFAFRTLSPGGKGYASHAYYSRPTGFLMPVGADGAKFSAMILAETSVRAGNRAGLPPNSILTEPTEALPNGIPGEAVLNVARTLQDGVFASTKGVRGGTLLTAQELGMRQGMLDANIGGGGMTLQYDTYQPAQIVMVSMVLDLQQFGQPSAYFKDGWLVNGSRAVGFDQLPAGFRAQVDQARQSMMKPPIPPGEGERVRIGRGGG